LPSGFWRTHLIAVHTPGRGDGALRRHRVSVPAASYFLTLCATTRRADRIRVEVASAIVAELSAIERDEHWVQRAGVLMPDHLHLFVRLNGGLALSRCVARLKARTRIALSTKGWVWQPNYYEHRLRPGEPVAAVIRYLYLNPYRAGLLRSGESYPWYWLGREEAAWFEGDASGVEREPDWLR
jgi:putative transposase